MPTRTYLLAEIAHTLESTGDAEGRLQRVVNLTATLSGGCSAILRTSLTGPSVVTASDNVEKERVGDLTRQMENHLRVLTSSEEGAIPSASNGHVTLPLVGLDKVMGVLRVEIANDEHDAAKLSLVSVISSQLGSYLAMMQLAETERVRAAELEAANDFHQLLVGVVSHDLRTPLFVIFNSAKMMLGEDANDRSAKLAERIARNADRARHIISDLLDVSQTRGHGMMNLSRQEADVGVLARDTVDDLRQSNAAVTIELEVPQPGTALVLCDTNRVAQIIVNLVNNAMQHGAPSMPIRVDVKDAGSEVLISVHNHGSAIPEAARTHLFDPFKRGRAEGGTKSGLGLGLFIVNHIVKAHGGTASIRSSEREGTTFLVRLPKKPRSERPGDGVRS